jgi:hypothetical protein
MDVELRPIDSLRPYDPMPRDNDAALPYEQVETKAPARSARATACPRESELASAAAGVLQNSPHVLLRTITCEFRDGGLLLQGQVMSYYLKQLAQERVKALAGVSAIFNGIQVVPYATRGSSGSRS